MGGEWREVTVSEIAATSRNALVGGPFGSNLVSRDYVEQGVPVVRGQNMGERWVGGDFVFVTPEKAKSLEANLAKPGDIVFTQRGTLGQVSLVPEGPYEKYLVSQSQMKLTVDRSTADALFFFYVFNSPEQQEHIRQNAIQTGVPHTNLSILRATRVPFPPLAEQKSASKILGALDDKIELNRRMNETLEAVARALFQSWFVDFEPVRAKVEGGDSGLPENLASLFPDRFEDSELGEVPVGWRYSRLGDLVRENGGAIQTGPFGSQLHAADYSAEGVPVVMPKDLHGRQVSIASIARVEAQDAERLSRHRLSVGDIIYSRRGDVERHALIGNREEGWLCGTGCLLVRPGPRWPSPLFLSMALDRSEARDWISQRAIGATMPNLNTAILSAVPVILPTGEILKAFERLTRPCEDRLLVSSAEVESLRNLRDTLLPKLISGELRIQDAEKFLENAL